MAKYSKTIISVRDGKGARIVQPRRSLRERFGLAVAGLRGSKSEDEFFRRRTAASITTEPLVDPYSQHPVVRACIDAIKDNIAGVPFNIYQSANTRTRGFNEFNRARFGMWDGGLYARNMRADEYKVVENQSLDLVKLFTSPNPVTPSGPLFWEASIIYMLRDGECVTVGKDRDNIAKVPSALFPVVPYQFTPKKDDNTGAPIGWKWINSQGKTKIFQDFELIRPRLPDPNNLLRGLPPYSAGKVGTETDWYAMLFNRNFFKNGAQLGGLLLGPPGMTKDQRDIAKESFNEDQAGVDAAFGIWLVSGANDFKELGVKHRDMHFTDLRKYSREEIAMLYRVPLTVLSVYEQVNYANARVQDKQFWRLTLLPLMRHIEELYWASLFRYVHGGRYWGAFDLSAVEALQEDLKDKLENANILYNMKWPINQINERLELGMENVAWGDTAFVPITVAPAETVAGGDLLPEPEGQGIEQTGQAPAIVHGRASDKVIWQSWIKFLTPYERRYNNGYKKYLFKLRKRQLTLVSGYEPRTHKPEAVALLEALHGGWENVLAHYIGQRQVDKATADQIAELLLFNQDAWDNALTQTARPLYVSVMDEAASGLSESIGGAGLFGPNDPEFMKALATKEHKLTGTNTTLRNNLKLQLVEGITAGETAGQLQDRVRTTFNFHENRSLTVARTEVGQAAEAGRFGSMKAEGVPGIWWLTAQDEAVRVSHAAAQAEGTIRLGMTFSSTQCRHPLDMFGPAGEIINCRCVGMPDVLLK